ncbi:MAG: MBL fold metallo-hydrolase [Xanthobacteraceae bacterium]
MEAFICVTCGTQYSASETPPKACAICDEERQYVLPTGQAWTTLAKLNMTHMATFREEAGLLGLGMSPHFGIGQRALLVKSPDGNVLWDCISLISPAIVDIIKALGGLKAIAISHPHYYTTMVEWSRAFGGIPVYLNAADRQWIMRSDPCLKLWDGDTLEIGAGLTLIRTGGHFDGGTVLHWAAGAGGRGALLSGDLLQVVPDRNHVGFMYSYPNFIPLGAAAVRTIDQRVKPWPFEAIYGAFWDRVIASDAKAAVTASVNRHITLLERNAV